MTTSAPADIDPARLFAEGAREWSMGRIAEAARAFAAAALLAPADASAHGNLGVALRRLGRIEAAVCSQRRAVALAPGEAVHHSNLGNALRESGHLAEAEHHLRRAAELAPQERSFAYNLALGLRDLRRHAEAEAMLATLAAARPDDAEVAWDLALSRLTRGSWREGFAGYESRLELARNRRRVLPGPRWGGGGVEGRTIFLHAEQGFGDALQFARFVPELAARGARVVLECARELAPVLATLDGVVAVVETDAPPPPYDLWAPLLSLPHLLGIDPPRQAPYLRPPRAARLARPPGTALAVGLVWAGKPTPRDRSWPVETLLPLLADPAVAAYSLQVGSRAADLSACGADALVRDLSSRLGDFGDTAAVMAELDLIVTIDSSPAHLAGALGRPVWVLLRHVSDWRWRDEGGSTPWYPTMRLFRQADPFDFAGPVEDMRAALAELRAQPPLRPSSRIRT